MSAFDQSPQFYENDRRSRRAFSPITKNALEWKCSLLLPETLIHGKSVLDLGCCLGAMGHWSLFHGAKSYVGVDVHQAFIDEADSLLESWSESVTLLCNDIRAYLNATQDNAVDVVVAAGVLQTFLDPQNIIAEMCRVAKEAVVVEATLPPLERQGLLPSHATVMQLCQAGCNIPNGDHQRLGMAGLLSRAACDAVFELYGFHPAACSLVPPVSDDTLTYSLPLPHDEKPLRFFERYVKTDSIKPEDRLEYAIINQLGTVQPWDNVRLHKACKKSAENNTVTAWKFDAGVAENFQAIAESNIPNYSKIIDQSIDVIAASGMDESARIVDVGCATGETLKRLQQAGYRNLVGVDSSVDMLSVIKLKAVELIESADFPKGEGPFDVVIANWTLHFIQERENYLKDIMASLTSGGCLILTEKTVCSDTVTSLYHEFKRDQGLSGTEIREKALRLQGVLEPYPVTWYYHVFYTIGGLTVDILSAEFGFITFLVTKK